MKERRLINYGITEISSQYLSVKINSHGAELQSLVDVETGVEYLWQADEKYWNRSAPILFPIVGELKDSSYWVGRRSYSLPRHGFARDMDFELLESSRDRAVFRLTHTKETLKMYPFKFTLDVEFKVYGPNVIVTYEVANKDTKEILFSIGSHPAFNVPISSGKYEDYFIEFEKKEANGAYYLENGLARIENGGNKKIYKGRRVYLTKDLFKNDALIFKDLISNKVTLGNDVDSKSVIIEFEECPYLGLWAPEGAPFVCIEPWYGVADSLESNNDFFTKEGLQTLEINKRFKTHFTISVR